VNFSGTVLFDVGPSQGYGALPSNKGMQLTIKSVTPFACAKAAPLSLAADPRCYTAQRNIFA
jgi:hypothetical protein